MNPEVERKEGRKKGPAGAGAQLCSGLLCVESSNGWRNTGTLSGDMAACKQPGRAGYSHEHRWSWLSRGIWISQTELQSMWTSGNLHIDFAGFWIQPEVCGTRWLINSEVCGTQWLIRVFRVARTLFSSLLT